MKNMKRMLGFVMAVMMILAMIPAVFAEEELEVIEVNGEWYETLEEAIAAVEDGGIINLNGNTITIDGSLTIDAGEFTITNGTIEGDNIDRDYGCIMVDGADLTLDDVDITVLSGQGYAVYVLDGNATILSGFYAGGTDCLDVGASYKTKLVLKGGTFYYGGDSQIRHNSQYLAEGYEIVYNEDEGSCSVVPVVEEVVEVTFREITKEYVRKGWKWVLEDTEEIFGDDPYELTAGDVLTTPEVTPEEHFVLDYWQLVGTDITLPADEYTFDDLVGLVEGVETTDEETGVITCTHTLVFEPVYKQVTKDVYITLTHVLNPLFKSSIAVMKDIDVNDTTINFADIVLPDGYYCIYTTVEGVWDGEIPLTKTLDSTKDTAFVMVVTE